MARRCDICGSGKKLEPDLCGPHLRGRLCAKCSDILSLANDDWHLLQAATNYVMTFAHTHGVEDG